MCISWRPIIRRRASANHRYRQQSLLCVTPFSLQQESACVCSRLIQSCSETERHCQTLSLAALPVANLGSEPVNLCCNDNTILIRSERRHGDHACWQELSLRETVFLLCVRAR